MSNEGSNRKYNNVELLRFKVGVSEKEARNL